VADQLDEGWKLGVSAGTTFGRVAELNVQSVIDRESFTPTKENPNPPPLKGSTERHRSGTMVFGLGYLRSTSWYAPNYLGVGAKIVDGARTEIYPLELGWFHLAEDRRQYWGVVPNVGIRIDNPYLKINPSSNDKYSLQFTIPAEYGFEIYSPFSVFARAELFALDLPGLGTHDPVSIKGYPLYLGYGSVTAGARLDVTGIGD
jgi:hypothetical protein